MNLPLFFIAGFLLSLERICYLWAWRYPESFRRFCGHPLTARLGEPTAVLQKLFYCFKVIQLAMFFAWCYVYGEGALLQPSRNSLSPVAGGILVLVGQALNFSVFYRLGARGVFYGNKYGYEIPWLRTFPFSVLTHPQYVGAVCSIWGFFFAMRFPHDDWYVLPLLETGYYAVGAYVEQ